MSVTSKTIALLSGKGGTGKTTLCASIGLGLALQGHKTVMIDFDIGMRNLDLAAGAERRVIYDFINVLEGEASLQDALIRDRHCDGLYLLAASQSRDQTALTSEGVRQVLDDLHDADFEYILCDSPPGMGHAAQMAYRYADEAIICVTPDPASVRAADRVLGLLQQWSHSTEGSTQMAVEHLLINRVSAQNQAAGMSLEADAIIETLAINLLTSIPECHRVTQAWHAGKPVIADSESIAGAALRNAVAHLTGQPLEVPVAPTKSTSLLERFKLR